MAFLFCLFLFLGGACQAQKSSDKLSNSFILKFRQGTTDVNHKSVFKTLELQIAKKLDLIDAYVCVYQGDMSAEELIERAKSIPEVEYLEQDQTYHAQ